MPEKSEQNSPSSLSDVWMSWIDILLLVNMTKAETNSM